MGDHKGDLGNHKGAKLLAKCAYWASPMKDGPAWRNERWDRHKRFFRRIFGTFLRQDGPGDGGGMCAVPRVDHLKDGGALSQMKDGTIFGTKEAHVRATTLCVRQSLEPFLSDRLLRNHSISDTFGGFSYSYAIAAECKFGTWHCHTDARQTLLNIPRKACIKYKVCDGGHLLLHEAVRLALIGYFADAL